MAKKNYKKSNNYSNDGKKGFGMALGALVLSAVLLVGGGAVGYGMGTDWTYDRNFVKLEANESGDGSFQLTEGEEERATFRARQIDPTEFENYGISTTAVESAYTATVTLANHNTATDRTITLSAEWKNGSSEWATGKNTTDYIEFSATTVQSGETFTIACKKAFGEPVILKGTAAKALNGKAASCTKQADYVRSYTGFKFTVANNSGNVANTLSSDSNNNVYNWLANAGSNEIIRYELMQGVGTLDDGLDVENMIIANVYKINGEWADYYDDWFEYDASDSDYILSGNNIEHRNSGSYETNLQGMIAGLYECSNSNGVYPGLYNKLNTLYQSNKPACSMFVKFTGKLTGKEYLLTLDFKVNPAAAYIAALDPSFSDDDIIFGKKI